MGSKDSISSGISLKEVLAGRDDEDGLTLIMPDYTAREIEDRVKLLIEGDFRYRLNITLYVEDPHSNIYKIIW